MLDTAETGPGPDALAAAGRLIEAIEAGDAAYSADGRLTTTLSRDLAFHAGYGYREARYADAYQQSRELELSRLQDELGY